jgi:hypothetical protein
VTWSVSAEYMEGYHAFQEGATIANNPYPIEDFPSPHADWYLGYCDAQDGE